MLLHGNWEHHTFLFTTEIPTHLHPYPSFFLLSRPSPVLVFLFVHLFFLLVHISYHDSWKRFRFSSTQTNNWSWAGLVLVLFWLAGAKDYFTQQHNRADLLEVGIGIGISKWKHSIVLLVAVAVGKWYMYNKIIPFLLHWWNWLDSCSSEVSGL